MHSHAARMDVDVDRYYMYTAADDETPGHIAHALDCPVADLISLNQHNFGKAFTKTAKLMEGTTVLVPHTAKKNPWEIPGQPSFGQPPAGLAPS